MNRNVVGLFLAISLATFDSLVLPYTRLSIGDIAILIYTIYMGHSKNGYNLSLKLLFIYFPLLLCINAIVYFQYIIFENSVIQPSLMIFGFLRPLYFSLMAIKVYYGFKIRRLTLRDIYMAISLASAFLTIVVILQYFGKWFPQFYNNPAFGETGRWAYFSEGWRPTGFTNEASFVGIFLVLMLALQLDLLKFSETEYVGLIYKAAPFVTVLGCVFTTSRISLVMALILAIFRASKKYKILIIVALIPIFMWSESELIPRLANLLRYNGDPSTIERYGSSLAYANAILSGKYFFGTGYLNGVEAASKYMDPAVREVLKDRNMPSFCLPLQALLEFGVPLTIFVGFFAFKILRKYFSTSVMALCACSLVTGLQNFLFVFVFSSLMAYVHNSCHK